MNNPKSALIIGITGQDGAYLSKFLLDKGYRVLGITRNILEPALNNLSFLGIEKGIELIEIVNTDSDRIERILNKYKPGEIYNLAAQSSVGQSFVDPFATVSYNILSVVSWLEGIKKYNLPTRFYQASSSEMFGNVRKTDLPLKESLIFHPASPYGVSKAAAHWLTVNYREANRLFCSCGILFNHESALRGPNYVVKKIINAAVKIKLGLRKENIKVGNISIKRDWGYAPKYVEAMWLILQHHQADDFLICSGNIMSLENLIVTIMNELGLDIKQYIQIDPNLFRPVDLEEIYGDNNKAKSLLKWDYKMSNEDLVKQLIIDEHKFIEWELSQK
jgi:GDPmannose 4,6-dehydratase